MMYTVKTERGTITINETTMNKETRTFIWGMTLLFLCSIQVNMELNEMLNGTWKCNAWQIFRFIVLVIVMILGARKVITTTD